MFVNPAWCLEYIRANNRASQKSFRTGCRGLPAGVWGGGNSDTRVPSHFFLFQAAGGGLEGENAGGLTPSCTSHFWRLLRSPVGELTGACLRLVPFWPYNCL